MRGRERKKQQQNLKLILHEIVKLNQIPIRILS